jgi:peptide/nickel transport system permease protein
MSRFLLRRSGIALITLLLASVLVFVGARALPGDPAIALSGEGFDPAANAAIRQKYGLDDPLPVQYGRWLILVVQGELGRSTRSGLPVAAIVRDRIPLTLELASLAMLLAIAIGLPAGVLAAARRGGRVDLLANAVALSGLSVPHFWLGLMLILLFASSLRLLPASGFTPFTEDPLDNLRRMILPAFVLGTGIAAVLMRQVRSTMIETLGADYVRTARAKGLSERDVIVGHALRNSLISVVTLVGLELGALISGSVITESIFLVPGFGRLIIDAVVSRDYPVIQAVALISAAAYIVLNLGVDVMYSLLNPKIRVTRAAA